MEENSNKPYIFDIKCRTSFIKDVYMNLELPSMKTLDNTIDDILYIEWTKHIGSNPIHSINIEFPNYSLILRRKSFYALLLVLDRLNIFLPNELKEIIFENIDATDPLSSSWNGMIREYNKFSAAEIA